jgi:hypothetical protein
MKVNVILGTLAATALILAASGLGRTASAGQPDAVATGAATVALAADEHEFLGSKSCRMCHSKTFKSWEASPHAQALEVLKPGNAAEEKTKHNLDPQKDYTTDASCLACHSTGFGKKGGFQVLASTEDQKAVKKNEALAGVGCEACHGPGGSLTDVKKDIQKNKRKYKLEELTSKGLIVPTAETCQTCHTETHPTFDAEDKFDFE